MVPEKNLTLEARVENNSCNSYFKNHQVFVDCSHFLFTTETFPFISFNIEKKLQAKI